MNRQNWCEDAIAGMVRRTSSWRLSGHVYAVLFVAAGLGGVAMRDGAATDIEIAGVKYSASIEDGKAVVRDATNQVAALPANAGLTVAAASDGKSVQVASTTGKAKVKTANGLSLSLAKPGDCLAVTESANGLRADVKAVSGKIGGEFTWMAGEIELFMQFQMQPGCVAAFTKGSMTVACHEGFIVLIGGDGTKFILDAGDVVKISAGAVPGTIVVTVIAGDGVKVISPDGTESILEVGQTFILRPSVRGTERRIPSTAGKGGGGSKSE